jgi:hypothetical protein
MTLLESARFILSSYALWLSPVLPYWITPDLIGLFL